MPMASQHLLVGHRLCQSGKVLRFTSRVKEKKVFDWTQDDQSFNIWLKTDVFQIGATYLSSGRTSLLQDSPKTWVVAGYIKEDNRKTNCCVLLPAIHTNLFVRVLRSKYNNLVEFDQAFCGQGRVEWSFARRRIV